MDKFITLILVYIYELVLSTSHTSRSIVVTLPFRLWQKTLKSRRDTHKNQTEIHQNLKMKKLMKNGLFFLSSGYEQHYLEEKYQFWKEMSNQVK